VPEKAGPADPSDRLVATDQGIRIDPAEINQVDPSLEVVDVVSRVAGNAVRHGGEAKGIRARSANHPIRSAASDERVVAYSPEECVRFRSARHIVVALSAAETVVPVLAEQPIIAGLAVKPVMGVAA